MKVSASFSESMCIQWGFAWSLIIIQLRIGCFFACEGPQQENWNIILLFCLFSNTKCDWRINVFTFFSFFITIFNRLFIRQRSLITLLFLFSWPVLLLFLNIHHRRLLYDSYICNSLVLDMQSIWSQLFILFVPFWDCRAISSIFLPVKFCL